MKSTFYWALVSGAAVFGVSAQAQTADRPAAPIATATTTTGSAVGLARAASQADSSRAYASQSLRFQSSWGSADIIRGADGPTVGTVGWFRNFDVEKLVESSPRAVTEARVFEKNNFRGSLASALGATTVAIGILVAGNSSNNASSPILIVGGAGVLGWGLQHINRGYAALSKALWWYNHDVAR